LKSEMCLSTFSRVLQLNITPQRSNSESTDSSVLNAHRS
jgi:hypothetical protein